MAGAEEACRACERVYFRVRYVPARPFPPAWRAPSPEYLRGNLPVADRVRADQNDERDGPGIVDGVGGKIERSRAAPAEEACSEALKLI
jgi:hypothetical protein